MKLGTQVDFDPGQIV